MEAFLEEKDVQLYSRGDVLHGRVVQVTDQVILVDIGYKSEAQLRPTELAPFREEPVDPGDEVEVIITYIDEEEGTIFVSEKQAVYAKWINELERHYRKGEPVLWPKSASRTAREELTIRDMPNPSASGTWRRRLNVKRLASHWLTK